MRDVVIKEICKQKIIAIVRGLNREEAVAAAKALYEGGITLVEVTFNQKAPETFTETAKTIQAIKEEMGDKMLVGAGTVTSPTLVMLAADAGAAYIISPDTDPAVIQKTKELGLVSIPGAYTPSEAKRAHNAGADFVKLFPCVGDAAAYVKAVCGPLNHIRFLAVGGVDSNNAASFLAAGAVGVGVGGNLVNKEWIKAGSCEKICAMAKEYRSKLNSEEK
ncbi:MAG: bifunctional 4-hydroxy-2-oxoglutarate aldolase/2-dehydro-3-deoxy-phosphogluconate aldolase [Clostridia bacterium]|nr:bifunctional 4-hydroxy-2-oxoglutarate aldolase/2-dehydro-3-deoxy-phosphogluconate aldolase [Clostridia bacterium]